MTITRTRVQDNPILEIPIENEIYGILLHCGNEEEVLVTEAVFLKAEDIGEIGVDKAFILIPQTTEDLLPLLETLLTIGDNSVGLEKNTVYILSSNRTTRTVFAVFALTDTLTHLKQVRFFFSKSKSKGIVSSEKNYSQVIGLFLIVMLGTSNITT